MGKAIVSGAFCGVRSRFEILSSDCNHNGTWGDNETRSHANGLEIAATHHRQLLAVTFRTYCKGRVLDISLQTSVALLAWERLGLEEGWLSRCESAVKLWACFAIRRLRFPLGRPLGPFSGFRECLVVHWVSGTDGGLDVVQLWVCCGKTGLLCSTSVTSSVG